ncbi:hypothetical protein [Streptomyces flavofungini]|uniref:hypothetical protein n=1 Tax=Streptomyces flavofungini TaxID=68200 RepID=UPI0034DF036A
MTGDGAGRGRTRAVIGAAVVVAAAAVGGYLLLSGTGDDGGSAVPDDGGTYELTAPATVLGGAYRKVDSLGGVTVRSGELKGMAALGVAHPEAVTAVYLAGRGSHQRMLTYSGVHGEVDDPEKVVDALFAEMERRAKDQPDGATPLGSPEEFTPDGFRDGVMKCRRSELRTGGTGTAGRADGTSKTYQDAMCVWGDHSTVGYVSPTDPAAAADGRNPSLDATARLTADLRAEVRGAAE